MHSAIYRGTVRHRRFGTRQHSFQYDVFMMYLDLDELDQVFSGSWLWSSRYPAPAWFRRADYLSGPDDLGEAVRQTVADETGCRPDGPIRVLTNLRYFGYIQNPITCYYCFDRSDEAVETIVLEVTNTPWKKRITYVLPCDPGQDKQRIQFDKALHVSPFLPMNMCYHWYGNTPAQALRVQLANHQDDVKVFDASLMLTRTELTAGSLRRTLMRYPAMTLKVLAGIYWQAAKLFFIKRVKLHDNPHSTV
jgi:DUF1365 family protein